MPHIEAGFVKQARGVEVQANIAGGWRKLETTYGFRTQTFLNLFHDWRIRVMVTVKAIPKRHGRFAETFPTSLEAEDSTNGIAYALRGGILQISVDLYQKMVEEECWLENARKPGFYWRPNPIRTRSPLSYELEILLVLNEVEPAMRRDTHEWHTPFPSAGLPSLGKRR